METAVQQTNEKIATLKSIVEDSIRDNSAEIVRLSQEIHADAEVSWEEHKSVARLAAVMRAGGFDVEVGAYGVETGLEASFGDGDLTVAICAEYDALPGVGHACGHNMIAAAGAGAAIALSKVAAEAGLRIKLLGTPAEEHGGGKVSMLTAGAWEDVDFSLMVHGNSGQDIHTDAFDSTAVDRFEVEFTGLTAHAAGAPEHGINAGSAATIALTSIAHLRQHIISADANLNAVVSKGGEATNIIPDKSYIQVEVRAYDLDQWRDLKRRTLACFEGAALATGCTWEFRATEHPYAPMVHEAQLGRFWDANLIAIGRTPSDTKRNRGGSTDMGNVSQVVPSIHGMVAVLGSDAVPHNPDFTAAAASPEGDQAVLDGATLVAWTVIDAALTPETRSDLQRRRQDRPAGATRVTLQA